MLAKFKKQDKFRTQEAILILKLWDQLNEQGITKFDKLLNCSLYMCLVNRDIYYMAEYYYFERNENRKNLFGRILSLTIFEVLDNINHLLGKELMEELKQNQMESYLQSIKLLSKLYSDWKSRFEQDLKLIRNNSAAHKNRDSRLLFKLCNELPINNITEIGYEMGKMENLFNEITNKMFQDLPKSLNK